jgi:hypothetical protein
MLTRNSANPPQLDDSPEQSALARVRTLDRVDPSAVANAFDLRMFWLTLCWRARLIAGVTLATVALATAALIVIPPKYQATAVVMVDTGSHLSYPFVFEHGGEMWMVPESCSTASVDLYRAERFPDGWVKQATLVSGVVASDATLFEHDGRWWMFSTVQDGGGSYSDALHLWSAPALRGPWTPHRRNPVLVDLATARPGGRLVRRGRKLIRPFQDCRKGYGTALGLAEIIHLDDDRFEQRVETILRPGPLWPGHRLHTLNRAGPLECIDGSASPRKLLPASGGRQRRPRVKRSPMTA